MTPRFRAYQMHSKPPYFSAGIQGVDPIAPQYTTAESSVRVHHLKIRQNKMGP